MKKFLSVVTGMMLAFGFTASAFAIQAEIPSETQAVVAAGKTQITLGGEIRVRGEMRSNTNDFDRDKKTSSTTNGTAEGAGYDQRVRLSLDAKVTPNTIGQIMLESGDSDTADNVTWGEGAAGNAGAGAKGIFGQGNAKKGDVRILQAWLQHSGSGLLGIPAGVKVGHQFFKAGYGLFFDHSKFGDDGIMFFFDPTKELHVELKAIKFDEGTFTGSNDSDAYVLVAKYTPNKDSIIWFDAVYVDDQGNLLPSAGMTAGSDIHFWNFGLRGATKVAGLGLKADIEIQSGKARDLGAGVSDIKFSGYAFMVGADYKLDPVKISLEYAYGSGDDNNSDKKIKTFVTSLGADPHYTYVYEYRTNNAASNLSGGLANTQYIKLGFAGDLAKDLSGEINGYWLSAVKKYYGQPDLGSGRATDSKNIGTEIDAKVTYKIDKGLQYWVEGGYLFAGNFWKGALNQTKADDAYAVRHGIQLNF